jgi:hypothetical protein
VKAVTDKETLTVALTRDSVCAADDIDAPHEKRFSIPVKAALSELYEAVSGQDYLARIAGGDATWVLKIGTENIAVLAQQWRRPMFLLPSTTAVRQFADETRVCEVHIEYHTQKNPVEIAKSLVPQETRKLP